MVTVHIGSILLWASIFINAWQSQLHGLAYTFWVASMIPVLVQLGCITHQRWQQLETAVWQQSTKPTQIT